MPDDAELLKAYAATRSEVAFGELVRRHLGLVYSVALRQTQGDVHLAKDVTQQVFIACAAKAAALSRHPVLGGWLYRTTRYLAIDALRAERRRRTREQQSFVMHESPNLSLAAQSHDALRPVLDDVISELNEADRDAVTLRFFENQGFAEIGAKLRLTENSARMRVERALDKLQARLARRGITSTAAALSAALSQQISVAAPAGLASTILGGIFVTAGPAASLGAGSLATLIAMSYMKPVIIATLALAGAGAFVYQQQSDAALAERIAQLQRENRALLIQQDRNQRQVQAALRPTATVVDPAPQPDPAATARARANRPVELEGNPGHLTAVQITGLTRARESFAGIIEQLHLTDEEQFYFLLHMSELNGFVVSGRTNALRWVPDPKTDLRVYSLFVDAALDDFYPRVQELLGPDRFAVWLHWKDTAPERPAINRIQALNTQLSAAQVPPLDESQTSELSKLLLAAVPQMPAIVGVPMGYVTQLPIPPSVVAAATAFLTPEQVQVLTKEAQSNPNIF